MLIGAELAGLGVIGTGGSLGAGSPVTVPEGILGVLLIVHGGDHVVAGWQTLWTGRYHRTNTSRLLDSITGDPRISEALDGILGAVGSLSAARQILSRTGAWREVAKQADNFVDDAARGAFEIAQGGGKHAGFLKNYVGKSASQIQKGIRSIEKEIADHLDKIANPKKHFPGWDSFDPRRQRALLNKIWPSDIARQREQLNILQGLLRGLGG